MVFIPTETGHWVSEDFERLARVVQDYDHNLQLRWIPPDHRTREDKNPYVIWDTLTNTPVLYASELDTPTEILTKLFLADNKQGNVLSRLEAHNNAQEIMDARSVMDKYEEMHDQADFLLNRAGNYVKMGKGIKLDGQRNRI